MDFDENQPGLMAAPAAGSAATRLETLSLTVKQWPTQPGIYIMRDGMGRILYVGKAKNIRNRIKSYFQPTERLTPKTRLLMRRVEALEFNVTNTELEALLLECNLIKKHRPKYNVRLKDDKNFPYVVLDFTHPYPEFRITRKVIPSPKLRYFGPFNSGVKDLARFVLKTFQIRDCSEAKFRNRTRPCLNYEIKTCTAPCVALVSEADYNKQVREALQFLKGETKKLVGEMRQEMLAASDNLQYEKARLLRDKIAAIERISEKQSAILADQSRDIDIIGYFEQETEVQWVVLFVRNGYLTGRRSARTPLVLDSFESTISGFLEQFYTSAVIPDEIWLAADFDGREVLEEFLQKRGNKPVKLAVKRNERGMRLLGMAHENAKLLYINAEKKTGASASEELQRALGLAEPPDSIEGIDVSNLQAQVPAVSLVHFNSERPLKSRYRLYYPKNVEGQNDFAMIHEVVYRRFTDKENPPPDLLLIDGGKGQLAAAERALEEAGVDIPLCSLAKARTERAFHLKDVKRSEERIFVPKRKNPIVLGESSPALRLLQRVRDEAHRFGLKSHRRRRKKSMLEESPLMELKGVGPKTRAKLLTTFGTMEKILAATDQELTAIGISVAVIDKIRALRPTSDGA